MVKNFKILSLIMMIALAFNLSAQVTTSGLRGTVVDETGAPMIGATVLAKHGPSGSTYGAVSNLDGNFTIQGMRTGGPYTVEVTYVGYKKSLYSDLYLQLGNELSLKVTLEPSSEMLDEVVVVGKGTTQAGAAKNFSLQKIQNVATVDRDVYDVVKNMPMAMQNKVGGISIAGSNNRYNSFQIDGTVSNDVFGLAASGTNGGQSSSNPISMDAIQEIQVVVSPFDVRQSGFTGGGINVITKQGTNDFHATAYTYYNNQDMYGRYDASQDYKKSPLTTQHTVTYGGNIAGPIVKDKLFFFGNVERKEESYPSSYYPGYGQSISVEDANKVVDKYYQMTGIKDCFGQQDVKQEFLSLLARLDWNINQDNKMALRYQYNNGSDDKYSAGYSSYYFNNSAYKMNNKTHSLVAELNSHINSELYNEVRASYTRVRDYRDVAYQAPLVYINNFKAEDWTETNKHTMNVSIGTDYSSGANYLNQDVYVFEDNFSWYKGRHNFTFGTHNEIFRMANLFIQANTGEWVYDGLDNFLADNPNKFVYKCTDPTVTEGNYRYAPVMKAGQFGLYAQDKFDIDNNLQLTYGIRFDIPVMFNDPTTNVEFNKYAYANGWDVRVGRTPKAKVLWSPRLGFRWYTEDTHKTLIRGGLGLFTGRVPFVWMSNAYTNNGVEQTGTTISSNVPSMVDPATGSVRNPGDLLNAGGYAPTPDIVVIDNKFRYPQVFRANLAWEQQLPYDVKFTLEGLYSKTFNNAYFENLALKQTGSVYAVPGVEASAAPYYSVDKKYYSVINTKNTNKGYSYSISASLEKSFAFGLTANASYVFGHSKSIYDGTSSVAYSNWKYNYAVDSNNPALSYSMFDQPHRVIAGLSYTTPKYANGWLQSTISLQYNGYNGMRYSLTMSESADFNGDGQKGNSLLYIPTKEELNLMTFDNEDSRNAFAEFCATDKYAKNHRGQYAERNGINAPWENQIDLHFAQDFFVIKNRGSKFQFTFDVLNFANMLNKEWGANYSSTYNVTPLTVKKVQNGSGDGIKEATYSSNSYTAPKKGNIYSRWHAQVGLKFVF